MKSSYLLPVYDGDGSFISHVFASSREDAELKFMDDLVEEYGLKVMPTWDDFVEECGNNYIVVGDLYCAEEFEI